MNNCQKIFICSYYRDDEKLKCKFAKFDKSEENRRYGRDHICIHSDHFFDGYTTCECEEAQQETDKQGALNGI